MTQEAEKVLLSFANLKGKLPENLARKLKPRAKQSFIMAVKQRNSSRFLQVQDSLQYKMM